MDEEKTEILDRSQGAKFLGIVAGYIRNETGSTARLQEIPVGRFSKEPKDMDITLHLGPQAIQDISLD